jgi:cytochrome c peroxidase
LILAFAFGAAGMAAAGFDWGLAKGFPAPAVPANNRMSAAKVELGRYLFYEKRMSVNGRESCGTCHRQESQFQDLLGNNAIRVDHRIRFNAILGQEHVGAHSARAAGLAFTDGRARAEGTTGQLHPRSSMSLVNVAYVPLLTWANPTLSSLEEQALVPMLGEKPIELGLKRHERQFLGVLQRDPVYQAIFPKAFPGEADPYTLANVTKAIAAFERTIISTRSPYDRYRWGGDASAISDAAKRGELLFFSGERGGCFQCHGGWNFGGRIRFEGGETEDREDDGSHGFFNTGVSTYAAPNRGVAEQTGKPEDVGKFRPPSLRNIAVTAPYMHDGSLATLEDVIDHYAAGGRMSHPNKSHILRPFRLSEAERTDLAEFLKSLTDDALLHDPRWSDPWAHTNTAASVR